MISAYLGLNHPMNNIHCPMHKSMDSLRRKPAACPQIYAQCGKTARLLWARGAGRIRCIRCVLIQIISIRHHHHRWTALLAVANKTAVDNRSTSISLKSVVRKSVERMLAACLRAAFLATQAVNGLSIDLCMTLQNDRLSVSA